MASHSERDFENAIEAELTGSGGYVARRHSAYDETLAATAVFARWWPFPARSRTRTILARPTPRWR